jgi:3-methyladenine DNA glycosylase/8-oxoguanine DNA glycosylase
MKLTLPARKPFNFTSVINSHGWRQLAPFSYDEASNTLGYILQFSNERVVELTLCDGKDGVIVETEKLERAEQKEVKEKVSWMFGLDMDFSRFYSASRTEPKLARVKQRSLGRVLRSPTVFEDVIKTILTTNTLWGATKNMTRRLVERFGASSTALPPLTLSRSSLGSTDNKAFPSPASIAASSPEVLKEAIRVGYRAPAIHQLAVRVANGKLDLESLKTSTLSTLELRKELMTINGVGPYAAANLLMILGRHDFIPIDSYALKMVSHEWYNGEPITAKEVEKRFEKWGEFKGLAFWFWDWKYNGG